MTSQTIPPLIPPTPKTWTLLLKSHRTTVLLTAHPTTPLGILKAHLLSALHERYPDGFPTPSGLRSINSTSETLPIPQDVARVRFAITRDPKAEVLVWEPVGTDDLGEDVYATPMSVGLKNGSMVGFRFVSGEDDENGEWEIKVPTLEGSDDEDEVQDALEEMERD